MSNINIFIAGVTTGSSMKSEILNISLLSDKGTLYIETLDNDLPRILADSYNNEIYNKQRLSKVTNYTELIEDKKILLVKDHDNILYKHVEEFLLELSDNGSNKITFWVNEPTIWFRFINRFFMFKGESPIIPEYINPYPIDCNSVYQYILSDDNNESKDIENFIKVPESAKYDSLTSASYIKGLFDYLSKE